MPELLTNGPNIPVRLMNELDEGRVVFFCGAGVSMGRGSDLPGFETLVEHVYQASNLEPDVVESAALDLGEQDTSQRRPNFDKALGLLERPDRLGPRALRETVIGRLSTPSTKPLVVHKALLALSTNKHGVRLVTTNFDNRFVEADPDSVFSIDAAPKLPIPKPATWSTLVHLHGRIFPGQDGTELVLTAADFGRAYLTERWAARFITELFREFTVVFVGYSVGDPVMGYMVDALAAERARGARFATAYAFADHDGTPKGAQQARDDWRAKNVEPLLYDRTGEHSLLSDTLTEWAEIRSDPFQARSHIAVNGITKMPVGPDDPLVARVVWALQDPVAAKALADSPPVEDEDDFPKLASWLESLDQHSLFCSAANGEDAGAGALSPRTMQLVDNGLSSRYPHSLDRTRAHLTYWIARHLHVPQVLTWILRKGGQMHPHLQQQVQIQLVDRESEIPPRLRFLWTVVVDQEPDDPWTFLWGTKHHQSATSEAERQRVEDRAVSCIEPRLVVEPGPSLRLAFKRRFGARPKALSAIDACGHIKLIVGGDHSRDYVKDVLESEATLVRHAETFTSYLERALKLAEFDDEIEKNSFQYNPSIAAHDQNERRDDWTFLIDLARDGYLTLAASNRQRADLLLRRWVFSNHFLFRRLALHALTENAKADIQLARRLLLAGRRPGVWEIDLRREVLRFFRKAGTRLPRSLRAAVVRSIHAGPKSTRHKRPDFARYVRYEKALRLNKLAASGARLDKRSMALAEDIDASEEGEPVDRDEFWMWRGKAQWLSDEEFAPKRLIEGPVTDLMAAIDRSAVSRDQFRGLVLKQPIKVISALRRLAGRNAWPPDYWQYFFWSLAQLLEQPRRRLRLREYIACILMSAPDEFFGRVRSTAAGFVKAVADDYDTERESALCNLWFKAWAGVPQVSPDQDTFDDPLTLSMNHPAGVLAEVALKRLSKYKPEVGSGLPLPIRPYFDAIAADQGGHLGRVMLMQGLYNLFAIDPDWTRENLIARLGNPRSQDTRDLWSAYCWSLQVGPDLLSAFRQPFLAMLRDGQEVGRHGNGLAILFMTICLEAPGELSTDEVDSVVQSMPELFLETVLSSCKQRLTGDLDEQGQSWRERIGPWLREYWPKAGARNTERTTAGMLEMLAKCGRGFPDASEWALSNQLRPTEGEGLYELRRSGIGSHYPDPMMSLLDAVVDHDGLPVYKRSLLLELLEEVKTVNPGITGDQRWQRLFQLATQ